jgi:ribonuclease PH
MRHDKRENDKIRALKIDPFFLDNTPHSVLISLGRTKVFCTATLEKHVPMWLKGQGKGWLTAEYAMLPRSSNERIRRERNGAKGRTQEIQRLIGRSLRSSIDLSLLGEKQIIIDCDVIQADGGTRTASITGGFVALSILISDMLSKKQIEKNPIKENVCAISAGINKESLAILDLDYLEDSNALVDMNIVMTEGGKFIEVQGTGEESTFTKEELDTILDLSKKSFKKIIDIQNGAIKLWEEKNL